MRDLPRRWDAVFWDIGGVIVDHDSVKRAHRSFVEQLVEAEMVEESPKDALDTWRRRVGEYFRERDGTEFRLAEDAYHEAVAEVVGEPVSKVDWRPLFDRAFADHVTPEPHVCATLDALSTRDVHLGIVSDIDDREARTILSEFGLTSTFDSVTTSEGVDRTKPDPKMFQTALDRSGAEPGRSLMIGDRYKHDVAGGAKAGMWTIAYGAEPGPAVDFRVDDLTAVVEIVDGNGESYHVD